jgi:cytochrome b561
MAMKRYHPALVTLHWLLAGIVIVTLFLGDIVSLGAHMLTGMIIGGLFVIRFIIKLKTKSPLPDENTNSFGNKVATVAHNTIYVLVFALAATGIGIAIEADLLQVLQSTGTLPDNFSELTIRSVHELLTQLFSVIITMHILAALYHQFVIKDRLFSRMWFEKRQQPVLDTTTAVLLTSMEK